MIPYYGGAAWVAAAVRSALSASVQHVVNVVVVDDGGPDRAEDALEAPLPGNVRIIRQVNLGVAGARTRGLLDVASHDAVTFLDQDDLLVTGALDILAQHLQEEQVVAAVGTPSLVDGDGRALAVPAPDLLRDRQRVQRHQLVTVVDHAEPIDFATLAYRNCIYTPGQVLIKMEAAQALGGFNSRTAPNDDWDFWLRLSRLGRLQPVSKVVLHVRRHGTNISSNVQLMRTMELALRGLTLRRASPEDRRTVLDGYRLSERELAIDWWSWSFGRDPGGEPRPFRWRMRGRAALFFGWSRLGLRVHLRLRHATGRLSDPRSHAATG